MCVRNGGRGATTQIAATNFHYSYSWDFLGFNPPMKGCGGGTLWTLCKRRATFVYAFGMMGPCGWSCNFLLTPCWLALRHPQVWASLAEYRLASPTGPTGWPSLGVGCPREEPPPPLFPGAFGSGMPTNDPCPS